MSLHIDCDRCVARGPACNDCVVTVLLGPPPEAGLDDDARQALDVLAGSGLVPPLRMVRSVSGPDVASADVTGVTDVAGVTVRPALVPTMSRNTPTDMLGGFAPQGGDY